MRELYEENEGTARYEISKKLFRSKMGKGTDIEDHILKIINLIDQLYSLGLCMDVDLQVDFIL